MKKIIFIFTFVFTICFTNQAFAQIIDPQYIFVRKDPMGCNPADCSQLWNMKNPNLDLYPGIVDVYNKIGTHGNVAGTRKIGIGVQLNYYLGDFNLLKQSLNALLSNSQTHTFPVYLSLNGFQWWDPNVPGFTPGDKNNVEWTCASPTCAISTSWRNWGSEFVVSPHPNIASRAFIDNNKQRLSELLPIIRNWYNALPADKKWLLGGIDLGTEVDVGANYYYYPNGVSNGGGVNSSVQLGYAAINTLSLLGGITPANLNEVIRRYTNELDKFAYDTGIPRNKIFNHIGAADLSPNPQSARLVFQTTDAGVNNYGFPSWSFYGGVAGNPSSFPGIPAALTKAGNSEWASPEWLTWAGDYNGWVASLRGTLNYRNNRFLNVANWEGIRDKPYALQAIRDVANESPVCWVTAPNINNVTVNNNTATITWQKGSNNSGVYLQISTTEEFTVAGVLANPNIFNNNVTTINSQIINNLSVGTYYVILVADGCGNQRKINDSRFVIAGTAPTFIPPTPTKVPTAVPTTNTKISGDYDGNGVVNLADFGEWKKRYMANPPTMTLTDFGVWKTAYLQ